MALNKAEINTIKNLDVRNLLLKVYDEIDSLHQSQGTNFLTPVNKSQSGASAPPPQASLAVSGANGTFSVQVNNPNQSLNKTLYHEISYSPTSNFTSDVTTLPVSTSTAHVVPSPGSTVHWRIRSSYDQKNWNSHATQPTPVSSGLQTSSASEAAVSLNQTNYATIDSVAVAGKYNVRVYGKGGVGSQYSQVRGAVETILPSATIVGATSGTRQVIGYDGKEYQSRPTLPEVLADGYSPIGAVTTGSATKGGGQNIGGNGGRLITNDGTQG